MTESTPEAASASVSAGAEDGAPADSSFEERRLALLGWLAGLLGETAPEGWLRLDIEARLLVGVYESEVRYTLADRSTVPGPSDDPRLFPALEQLRELYYEPGLGTWFSVRLCAPRDDRISFAVNADWEPFWRAPLPASAYRDDLERFPVGEEIRAPWLSAAISR